MWRENYNSLGAILKILSTQANGTTNNHTANQIITQFVANDPRISLNTLASMTSYVDDLTRDVILDRLIRKIYNNNASVRSEAVKELASMVLYVENTARNMILNQLIGQFNNENLEKVRNEIVTALISIISHLQDTVDEILKVKISAVSESSGYKNLKIALDLKKLCEDIKIGKFCY